MIKDQKVTKYISLNNNKFPVWLYGSPKNPAIIFLHGYPLAYSQIVGDLPIRHLKKKYFLIAFDLPGFGYAKNLKDNAVSTINQVRKEVIPSRKFVLFGASLGGATAIEYFLSYPRNVDKIIIAGLPNSYLLSKASAVLKPVTRSINPRLEHLFHSLKLLDEKNLSKIEIPALLLFSSKDKIATVKMGRRLKSFLPNSQFIQANNRTHGWLLHRINQNNFLKAINRFLES